MRIHKFLAQAGVCSRREAERLVASGSVLINGKLAVTGQPVRPFHGYGHLPRSAHQAP
jgi:23S rRNA pseudouridine2604 synthase